MADTKALTPQDELCQTVSRLESQFKAALPPHITAERFVRIATTAIRNEPKLANCDRSSVLSAFMQCAQDGLLPDKQEAAIVTYGQAARYMPMIKGVCKKARNSGEIKTINAAVVYEKDEYSQWVDETGEHFKHVKARGERGEPILTYAYAVTKDGGFYMEEIDETQMKAIEASSKAGGTVWKGPFRDEMKRKSAIRRLAKYRLPSSTDLDGIIRSEDDLYEMDKPEPTPAAPTSSRLSKILDANKKPVKTEQMQDVVDAHVDDDIPYAETKTGPHAHGDHEELPI